MKKYDIVIVGGGLSGLRAAVEAHNNGLSALIISKLHPVRSHSGAAQGGINAALCNNPEGKDDSWERHCYDTVKGSDFLADQDAVETMTKMAPSIIYEMEHWGTPFSRTDDSLVAQRPFGGAGFPRTCFAADKTGLYLLHTLWEKTLELGIETIYEHFVLKLCVTEGKVDGVIVMDMQTSEVYPIAAKAVIFGTGGAGRIYGKTSNALTSTGLGMAIPYREGVPLKDIEFVQFHPTGILGKHILMTEGCRGEGGYLINNDGKRFMSNYVSKEIMELAPRDIVARSIQTEINEGRGINGREFVHLDLRHLGKDKIMERLPGIRDICMDFHGIDPIYEPIPIHPVQHYTMGGIDTNSKTETLLKGFYACGECACVSVHGANRLGGNSLLETIVFGKISGGTASEYVKSISEFPAEANLETHCTNYKKVLEAMFNSQGDLDPYQLKAELAATMDENVGIFRENAKLVKAVESVKEIKEKFKNIRAPKNIKTFNMDLIWILEISGNIDVAECMALGALERTESRGSHFRTDFSKRDDDNWLKHTIATYSPEGAKLSYKDVVITRHQPEERKY